MYFIYKITERSHPNRYAIERKTLMNQKYVSYTVKGRHTDSIIVCSPLFVALKDLSVLLVNNLKRNQSIGIVKLMNCQQDLQQLTISSYAIIALNR